MTVNGEYFWMVHDSGDVVWVGDSEDTARAIAEAGEYWTVQQCVKCG